MGPEVSTLSLQRWGFDVAVRFVIDVVGPFRPLMQSLSCTSHRRFLPLDHIHPFPIFYQGFTRLFNDLNKKQTKHIKFLKTLCVVFTKCELTASPEQGCFYTLRLLSLGGELTLFFSILLEKFATKVNRFSSMVSHFKNTCVLLIAYGRCGKFPREMTRGVAVLCCQPTPINNGVFCQNSQLKQTPWTPLRLTSWPAHQRKRRQSYFLPIFPPLTTERKLKQKINYGTTTCVVVPYRCFQN